MSDRIARFIESVRPKRCKECGHLYIHGEKVCWVCRGILDSFARQDAARAELKETERKSKEQMRKRFATIRSLSEIDPEKKPLDPRFPNGKAPKE